MNVDGLNSGLPGKVTYMIPFIKKMLLTVSSHLGICKLRTGIVSTKLTIKNSNMDIISKNSNKCLLRSLLMSQNGICPILLRRISANLN